MVAEMTAIATVLLVVVFGVLGILNIWDIVGLKVVATVMIAGVVLFIITWALEYWVDDV